MTAATAVPTLTDGVVTLRAHQRADAGGVLEQCRDPLSRRWTTVPLDYTYADALQFVNGSMPDGWAEDTEWGFAVEAVDDGGAPRFAGTVSLRNERVRRAEVAYGSHPWARGRGLMERSLRLLLAWGFEERGLETVIWWANRGNWASRKLAWRLGFQVEGAPRRWLNHRGELLDSWVGTLLASDPRTPLAPWYDAPRLIGPQVVLRPLVHEDAERLVEGCLDPETARWLGVIPQPFTLDHAHRFVEDETERQASGRAVTWAVAEPGTERFLGLVNLFDVRREVQAEVGYWLHPEGRHRGLATEACRLAVRHALVPTEDGGLGLVRVRAVAAEGNLTSRRVLERSGFLAQGRERRLVRLGNGDLADAVVYDLLADELRTS